jgi:metallo-beta-lactamase class B
MQRRKFSREFKIESWVKQPINSVAVHLTTHPFSNGLTEIREKVISRKPADPNPLVDSQGLLDQLAYLHKEADERPEIERRAGR